MKPPIFPRSKDRPRQVSTSVRLDEDVVTWFRQTGYGYSRRINEALRWFIRVHEAELEALEKAQGESKEGAKGRAKDQ